MYNTDIKLTWGLVSKYRSQIYGFTIFWILIFHIWEVFRNQINYNWSLITILRRGNMGVDIFLFLSGVSLYFSLKRNKERSLSQYFKKRYNRIISIYFFICIPYFLLMLTTNKYTISQFIKQIFFINKNVSSFWFLLVISICYAIYPILYHLIESERKHVIYIMILAYTIFLIIFNRLNNSAYLYFEILLSRLPIFALGSTFGDKVYHDEPILPKFIIMALFMLLILGPINTIVAKSPALLANHLMIQRYMLGLQGISVVVCFIIVIQYLEKTYLFSFLGWLGEFSLELYIVHIILRGIALSVLGIQVKSTQDVLLFSLFYIPLSVVLSYILHKRLKKKAKNAT